jgi:hypothetical protein
MYFLRALQAILLNAVVATGAGSAVVVAGFRTFTFYVEASGITSGGTMKLQALAPSGNWVDIDSRAITANGNYIVTCQAGFTQIRANLSARTDGTYTVSCDFIEA